MFAALLAAAQLSLTAPELPRLPPLTRSPQITYLDRNGAVIGVRGGQFAPPVDLARLPAYVPAAFVSIEDRRFYDHEGIDPRGLARAIVTDLTEGKRQGGSTITQQTARLVYLNTDQTIERKATEAVYAIQLERLYSKKQILALYLSRANYGSGAYGLEAAAQRYFNKPAARLTIREAAMLAAIMKSPTNYNPVANREKSDMRTRLVLDSMVETGAITAAQRTKALAEKPKVWMTAPTAPAQYFIDWLDAQARQAAGSSVKQDLVVETTLDLPSELAAAEAAKAVAARYAKQGVEQAAIVTLDGFGRVRTLVGGLDYQTAPFNRAVNAKRQPGSAWKPFVYLAALETGRTPDMPVVDEQVTINGWTPRNYEPGFMGPITLQQAFTHSVNTVAARLGEEVGRANIAIVARRMGIVSPINTDPAMALGTSLVSPLELAQAYDPLGNGGFGVRAYGIERIRAGGKVIYQRPQAKLATVAQNPALNQLQQMMRSVMTSGTGVNAAIPGYDLAGKTGTTSDYRDAWFAGYTGGMVTVVWVGRDNNRSMVGITGAKAPSEIWKAYMRTALKRLPNGPILPGAPASLPVAPTPVADPATQAQPVAATPTTPS